MFENVDGRTDDRVTGILIAHLGACGSGELNRAWYFMWSLNSNYKPYFLRKLQQTSLISSENYNKQALFPQKSTANKPYFLRKLQQTSLISSESYSKQALFPQKITANKPYFLTKFQQKLSSTFTHYYIIAPFNNFEISCIWKYNGKQSICSFGANAPFSKVFKTSLQFLLIFFNIV